MGSWRPSVKHESTERDAIVLGSRSPGGAWGRDVVSELRLYGVLGSSAALKYLGEGSPGGAPVDR